MPKDQIVLECIGYTLIADGGKLLVKGKKEEEVFSIQNLQAFTLKEPKGLTRGSITFSTAQAPTVGIRSTFGTLALGAEKMYVFRNEFLDDAKRIRDYIVSYSEQPTTSDNSGQGMVVSVVDEIRGLKALMDEGILTQEEFELKKRQLLGI